MVDTCKFPGNEMPGIEINRQGALNCFHNRPIEDVA